MNPLQIFVIIVWTINDMLQKRYWTGLIVVALMFLMICCSIYGAYTLIASAFP